MDVVKVIRADALNIRTAHRRRDSGPLYDMCPLGRARVSSRRAKMDALRNVFVERVFDVFTLYSI